MMTNASCVFASLCETLQHACLVSERALDACEECCGISMFCGLHLKCLLLLAACRFPFLCLALLPSGHRRHKGLRSSLRGSSVWQHKGLLLAPARIIYGTFTSEDI